MLALPVVLPLMLLIAAVIKIVSRGPVFFRQERVGYLGRPFMLLKFRTMQVNAAQQAHAEHLKNLMNSAVPMKKMDGLGDPRLIPFGLLLRSTGLDELPQLINVLRGEMSLVGPRPCTPYEYAEYKTRHKRRLAALPGLTGLWQVNGKNNLTFEQMINLDLQYIAQASLFRDLRIMSQTIPALARQVSDIIEARKQAYKSPATAGSVRATRGQPVAQQPRYSPERNNCAAPV